RRRDGQGQGGARRDGRQPLRLTGADRALSGSFLQEEELIARMRSVPSLAVIALAISSCLPPAKAVELPRSAIGSEQARVTALMLGPSKDEAAASGFSVAAVTDE